MCEEHLGNWKSLYNCVRRRASCCPSPLVQVPFLWWGYFRGHGKTFFQTTGRILFSGDFYLFVLPTWDVEFCGWRRRKFLKIFLNVKIALITNHFKNWWRYTWKTCKHISFYIFNHPNYELWKKIFVQITTLDKDDITPCLLRCQWPQGKQTIQTPISFPSLLF